MNTIFPLAILTLKEGLRHRMLHGIAILALLMTGASTLIPSLFMYDLGKVAIDIGLSTITMSGMLIIFFLAINIIGKDLDKKTIYMVLATSTSRAQYILGKFLGVCLLLLASFLFLSCLLFVTVCVLNATLPHNVIANFSWTTLLYAQLFLFLELVLIASVVFFFMSFCSSFYIALILSGSIYLIGTGIESVQLALAAKEIKTSAGLSALMQWIKWIFPNLSAFDLKTLAAYGLPVHHETLALTFAYWFFYTTLLLLCTIFFFNRRELS
ncbi:MAG: hypothetical protein NTW42_02345 [Deltaproteobacteria bacterium]|nr:hypothetical protein [Deltaproteobacteria bacterium]